MTPRNKSMSDAIGLFMARTAWSLGAKIGAYARARKEARESREWAWQALRLFGFVFAVSVLAIAMFEAIRS
jgi:hypothetical protein